MFKVFKSMVVKVIRTADGQKEYFGTEIEDESGDWDDSYAISDGFWVIHNGRYHDIYR